MTLATKPTTDRNPVSLELLLDLLAALETEVDELPNPAPLFAHELERTLAETLGVGDDGG